MRLAVVRGPGDENIDVATISFASVRHRSDAILERETRRAGDVPTEAAHDLHKEF